MSGHEWHRMTLTPLMPAFLIEMLPSSMARITIRGRRPHNLFLPAPVSPWHSTLTGSSRSSMSMILGGLDRRARNAISRLLSCPLPALAIRTPPFHTHRFHAWTRSWTQSHRALSRCTQRQPETPCRVLTVCGLVAAADPPPQPLQTSEASCRRALPVVRVWVLNSVHRVTVLGPTSATVMQLAHLSERAEPTVATIGRL